jgi:hypothetical protein
MSDELEQEIESLRRMSRQRLQDRWCVLFKAVQPAAFTPYLLARGIAWRLQEAVLGGLTAEARRLLGAAGERGSPTARPELRPGNRLIRRWRGRTYVVEAVDGGFTFDGVRFGSLSQVANKITGTRWSGPRFFGLVE